MSPQSIFTIDVEDWFNLSGTGHEPPFHEWDRMESRVERNFMAMLDLLSETNTAATCFFLGYVAKRFGHLVREAVSRGHEVASHGYYHRLIYQLSPDEFRDDAANARKLLEDVSGKEVLGFRAPAFSVTAATPWFFDKVLEAGYRYDSSLFPAPHQTGGSKVASLGPYTIETPRGRLVEFPISAIPVLGKPMCFFGGGYLRLFPYAVVRTMAENVLKADRPVIFYVHPREIDPDQPRMPLSRRRRFTSYVNLKTTSFKIEHILRDFSLDTFHHYLSTHSIPVRQVLQ